ncbi:MAG: hypothetical protein V4655_01840 [Bdellovibrionota bacterium]
MILRISILAAIALIPYGCNSNNVAADYIAKSGSGSASGLKTGDSTAETGKDKPSDELKDDDKTSGDSDDTKGGTSDEVVPADDKAADPAVPKKEEEKVPTVPPGDAVAGAAILKSTCSICHAPGKPGQLVILNAAAIPRLDDAVGKTQAANHAGFKEMFAAPNRANLEAAMKAAK